MDTYFRDKIEQAAEIFRICNEENIEPVPLGGARLANWLQQVYGLVELYTSPFTVGEDSELRAVLEAETPDELERALRQYTVAIVLWAKAEVDAWSWLEQDELKLKEQEVEP